MKSQTSLRLLCVGLIAVCLLLLFVPWISFYSPYTAAMNQLSLLLGDGGGELLNALLGSVSSDLPLSALQNASRMLADSRLTPMECGSLAMTFIVHADVLGDGGMTLFSALYLLLLVLFIGLNLYAVYRLLRDRPDRLSAVRLGLTIALAAFFLLNVLLSSQSSDGELRPTLMLFVVPVLCFLEFQLYRRRDSLPAAPASGPKKSASPPAGLTDKKPAPAPAPGPAPAPKPAPAPAPAALWHCACGYDNKESSLFCSKCGSRRPEPGAAPAPAPAVRRIICPHCSCRIDGDSLFCPKCGKPLH